jgi:hypothetical protein
MWQRSSVCRRVGRVTRVFFFVNSWSGSPFGWLVLPFHTSTKEAYREDGYHGHREGQELKRCGKGNSHRCSIVRAGKNKTASQKFSWLAGWAVSTAIKFFFD